jgi:hypothetical protein
MPGGCGGCDGFNGAADVERWGLMADELANAIKENATGPKRAQGDSGSVEQHALTEQIEADRYLASKEAAKKGLGVRMTRVIPPGAT